MRAMFTLTAILLLACSMSAQEPKDYTNTPLKELGVELVKPTKDAKTGFLVAGKNETDLIRKLDAINGRSIADLEKDMRPGAQSKFGSLKGFLGKDEKLLDVLALDNDFVVGKHKLTHQELARHLHVVAMIGMKLDAVRNQKPSEFLYHGQRLRVTVQCYRGYQLSPFDDGTRTNCDAAIENLTSGAKVGYSMLVPHMIERYGFYEGKGTPYRVEPAHVLAVFPFLTEKKSKKITIDGREYDRVIDIVAGQSVLLSLEKDLVAQGKVRSLIVLEKPEIADFDALSVRRIRILGLKAGTTDFSIKSPNGNYSYRIRVFAPEDRAMVKRERAFDGTLNIVAGQDHVLKLKQDLGSKTGKPPTGHIILSDPKVADFHIESLREIRVKGLKEGLTDLMIIDRAGQVLHYEVRVTAAPK